MKIYANIKRTLLKNAIDTWIINCQGVNKLTSYTYKHTRVRRTHVHTRTLTHIHSFTLHSGELGF